MPLVFAAVDVAADFACELIMEDPGANGAGFPLGVPAKDRKMNPAGEGAHAGAVSVVAVIVGWVASVGATTGWEGTGGLVRRAFAGPVAPAERCY